jgi:nucleoid-associated protein YgaU
MSPSYPASSAAPAANAPVFGYSLQGQSATGALDNEIPAAILDIDHQGNIGGNNGDVKGGFKIIPEHQAIQPSSRDQNGGKYIHVVKKGETLRILARKFYGDENAWKRIYDANRSTLNNPDNLNLGMSLVIP